MSAHAAPLPLSNLWMIVPAKPLCEGKSRLAGVLPPAERQCLNRDMLIHTLGTARALPEVHHLLVISRDPSVLKLAEERGALPLREENSGLNRALYQASNHARAHAADGVLVLPTDLPNVTADDLRAFIQMCQPPGMVIAPDQHRMGTNALLIAPPGSMRFLFGERSFHLHVAEGRACGLHVTICERPAFGLDIDLPQDLHTLNQPPADEYGRGSSPP